MARRECPYHPGQYYGDGMPCRGCAGQLPTRSRTDRKPPATNPAQATLFGGETAELGVGIQGGLPPHRRESETSRAAAAAQLPELSKLQRNYLAVLRERGPTTDHEAADALRRPLSSINARRGELMAYNPPLVRDSGTRKRSPFSTPDRVIDCVAWELNPEAFTDTQRRNP